MRFYRPVIKQPISTFVEAPLELMAAKALDDQTRFEKSSADLDAQDKLLGNLVVHDYFKEEKDAKIQAYQQELEKARDILLQTGDSRQAASKLHNVQKGITQDKFLSNVQNISKSIWDTEEEMRKNKKTVSAWNNFYNPYAGDYSKNWKNPDGSIKAWNPGQLFEEDLNLNAKAKEFMEGIKESGYSIEGDDYDPTTGRIINSKRGSSYILPETVQTLSKEKAADFLRSPEGAQFMRMNTALNGGKPLTDAQQLGEAQRFLFSAGSNQIHQKTERKDGFNFVGNDIFDRLNEGNEQYKDGLALQAIDLENISSAFKPQKKVKGWAESKDAKSPSGVKEYGNEGTVSYEMTPYNNLPKRDQQVLDAYLDSKGDSFAATAKNIRNGTASQEALKTIYRDVETFAKTLTTQLKVNNREAMIADPKRENKLYTGIEEPEFALSKLTSGSGFLKASDQILDSRTGEPLTIKELGEKFGEGYKATINKKFSPLSGFYILSGKQEGFANARQLEISDKDGNVVGTYAIPTTFTNSKERANVKIAQNNDAYFNPNVKVKAHDSDYRLKFVPLTEDKYTKAIVPLTQEEINATRQAGIPLGGKFEIYDTKGNLIDEGSSLEEATVKIEEQKLKK